MGKYMDVYHRRIIGWPMNFIGDIFSLLELPNSELEAYMPPDLEETILYIMHCLSDRGVDVIDLLYIQSLSTHEAAVVLKISVPSVSRNRSNAMDKLTMQCLRLQMGNYAYKQYKSKIGSICGICFTDPDWKAMAVNALGLPDNDVFRLNRLGIHQMGEVKQLQVITILHLPIESESKRRTLLIKAETNWRQRNERVVELARKKEPDWPENLLKEILPVNCQTKSLEHIEECIARVLTKDESAVVRMHYQEKMALLDISKAIYVTYEAVRRWKNTALSKLKKVPWLFLASENEINPHVPESEMVLSGELDGLVLREETIRWLKDAGISEVSVLAKHSASDLKSIPRCTRKRLLEIQLALQLAGLALHEGPEED